MGMENSAAALENRQFLKMLNIRVAHDQFHFLANPKSYISGCQELGGGARGMGVTVDGHGVSFGGDENILEWLHNFMNTLNTLKLLNCTV